MKILVTGGTGFLGRHLVEALVEAGHEVVFQGRNTALGTQLSRMGARFQAAELSDAVALEALCRDCEAVIHCAALSQPWGPYRAFHQANFLGTRHLIAACHANHVGRLVHISTPGVYFDGTSRRDIAEHGPLTGKPANAYVATKLEAEKLVARASQQGLATLTLRPRALFGPHDHAILPRLLRVARTRPLPLFHNGDALIDVTYVTNVVDAAIACLTAPSTCFGKVYNITNGEPTRVADLFRRMFGALELPYRTRPANFHRLSQLVGALECLARISPFPWEPPFTRYTLALIALDQTLDISAARRDLSYRPRISLDRGLELCARWWREAGLA